VSRHQARRRRTYGRRQHELLERRERGLGPLAGDLGEVLFDDEQGAPERFGRRGLPALGLFSARLGFADGRA
jgi:hypothetical protein